MSLILSFNGRANSNSLKSCAKCSKPISVSSNYKGKKSPTCFNCRPWNCKHCTYSNDANLTACEICFNSKN